MPFVLDVDKHLPSNRAPEICCSEFLLMSAKYGGVAQTANSLSSLSKSKSTSIGLRNSRVGNPHSQVKSPLKYISRHTRAPVMTRVAPACRGRLSASRFGDTSFGPRASTHRWRTTRRSNHV